MSDADNPNTPEVKLDAGGGFMPEPAPPRMTPEEAGLPAETMADNTEPDPAAAEDAAPDEISLADVQPDGSVAVPQDTARRALEAVQVLVENNRGASQQLEALMGIVLDAAEVANRSASAVATSGGHVNRAAEKLVDGAERSSTQAKLVLGIAGAVLVGAAGVFSFMSVQLQNKVAQLDEVMLAVGKRAVDLKRRMETMDEIQLALQDLKVAQESTQSVQQVIEERIAKLAEAPPPRPEPAKPAATPPPAETAAARKAAAEAARERAAKTQAENRQLLQQLTTLDAMLKEQSKAVKELSAQVGTLQGSVSSAEELAAQQRLREKEMAQELAAEKARRQKELRDKERELVRERERAREREAAKERELAREREAARERQAAVEREAERQRAVSYRRDQSRPTGTPPDATVPTFTSSGGTQPAPRP